TQVGIGHEGGGFIGAGTPHLSVRDKATVDLTALGAGAGVVHFYVLAVGKFALSAGCRAGALGSGEDGEREEGAHQECNSFLHENLLVLSTWHLALSHWTFELAMSDRRTGGRA